jgi:hypothetical protein
MCNITLKTRLSLLTAYCFVTVLNILVYISHSKYISLLKSLRPEGLEGYRAVKEVYWGEDPKRYEQN